MKAGDYVKVLDEVRALEASSYYDFDRLWKKLCKIKLTNHTLTDEEYEAMDYLIRAIQSLGYIRMVLEKIGGEE